MAKVDELKNEIEKLPKEEFTELVRWLSEKDWERWDKEIEADSEAGRLDFLVHEAFEAMSTIAGPGSQQARHLDPVHGRSSDDHGRTWRGPSQPSG